MVRGTRSLVVSSLLVVSALALVACGGSEDNGDGGAAGASGSAGERSGAVSGAAGSNATNDGGTASSGGTGSGAGTASGGGAPSEAIAACRDDEASFADSGATEYVQWSVDGKAMTATPPAGGAYFFNGFLNMTTYAASLSGSVSVGVAVQQESFAAGTYRCREGEATGMVSVNGLGVANQSAPGADCAVTYEEDVQDGGRLKGTFWAYFPMAEWPVASPGGCVHGRFDVTDAADP